MDLIAIISSFRSPGDAHGCRAVRLAGVISALSCYLLRKPLESQPDEDFFLTTEVRWKSFPGQVSDAARSGWKRHPVTWPMDGRPLRLRRTLPPDGEFL